MACGRPQDDELVIPRPSGGQWTREDWANWRRRVWRPAAIEAGVSGDLRPYRLRGSFVSLLLWEGHSLTYVAEQAGHSIATLARHYAGTLKELETEPRIPAAEAIRQARGEVCGTHSGRTPRNIDDRNAPNPQQLRLWTMLGSNQRPPPCRDGALPAELIVRER